MRLYRFIQHIRLLSLLALLLCLGLLNFHMISLNKLHHNIPWHAKLVNLHPEILTKLHVLLILYSPRHVFLHLTILNRAVFNYPHIIYLIDQLFIFLFLVVEIVLGGEIALMNRGAVLVFTTRSPLVVG